MLLADITLEEWLTAAGIFVGSIALAVVLGRVVNAVLQRRTTSASLAIAFVSRLVRWTVVLIGLVYAGGQIGVEIGPLIGALGITGLAVALALQPVLQNLFAGVVLQTERPIDCGEEIETMDHKGLVLDVTSRATVVQTYDGAVVHIPNAEVLGDAIVNHTRNGVRRSTVGVGVAYASDVAAACSVLAAAAATVDGVHTDPAPQALARDFGSSSVDIDVDYWHDPPESVRRDLRSAMVDALHRALRKEGFEIPFPQRDVWMRGES
ncbi:MAG: mechanosensitive ion channel family protein [Actinomycetota bacterium]